MSGRRAFDGTIDEFADYFEQVEIVHGLETDLDKKEKGKKKPAKNKSQKGKIVVIITIIIIKKSRRGR